MKKTSSARRVPRTVGRDDDEDRLGEDAPRTAEPAIKRPLIKPRKSTNLRKAFTATDDDDESSEPTGVVTPRRSNVAKTAIQRNAAKRAVQLPPRRTDDADDDDDKPSYDLAALNELKASTPSTPLDLASVSDAEVSVHDVSQATRALDLSSKFGASLARYQPSPTPSAIPSATEIAEKKARRARLAKEHAAEEYISLDPDDPSLNADEEDDENVETDIHGRLVLKAKDKWGESESRLVKEDEDLLENFEDFTEDGKVLLGRKAEKEAARRKKEEMAAQIAAAEGEASDDSEDDAERERMAAFDAQQTRHGTYAAVHNATPLDPYANQRATTPPIISPIPTLDGVVTRLRTQLAAMQSQRARKLAEMSALQREKVRLAEEEVRIQRALRETAEKFAALRREKGIEGVAAVGGGEASAGLLLAPEGQDGVEDEAGDGDADQDASGLNTNGEVGGNGDGDVGNGEASGPGHAGLGFAGMNDASGLGLGMGRLPAAEDDW
ncbi:hypothetical protein LTR53_002204 [Teratosphaeriaceae sp. CCFEE 6253]|nr:hypothetical protein LTR53_002204 [Teratosphaeriaceae sp. CCFEE 6253]